MTALGDHDGLALRVVELRADLAQDPERVANLRAGLACLPPDVARRLGGPVALAELETRCAGASPLALVQLHTALQLLARAGALELADCVENPVAVLAPISTSFVLDLRPPPPRATLRLSRFACIRRDGADLVLDCPLGLARVTLIGVDGVIGVSGLLGDGVGGPVTDAGLLQLLWIARAIYREDDPAAEALDPTLRQWEFHDLLFHSRSRLGRHDQPMGGQYRFHGELPPQPALKPVCSDATPLPLYRPSPADLVAGDPPFAAVLESRQSVRTHGARPITAAQLGEFLFRVARVRGTTMTEHGELTNRPYPSGGASYELEIYLTIAACADLAPGFYHYDPAAHALRQLSPPNEDTAALLLGAYTSSARQCLPQVLLTIASRFQRVAWKYSGMAYATQLKNLGALYGVMYLAATAMRLAPCGLGLGDVERFCRLAGTSPFAEASIGEFMLGSMPT